MSEQDQGADPTISVEEDLDQLREGIDDPMVLKQQLAKETAARRQLTARAIKAETELKARKANDKPVEAQPIINNETPTVEDERFELRLSGYSKSDVDFILANGGADVLKDPSSLVSIALKTAKEQREAEIAASQTDGAAGEDSLSQINFSLPRNPSLKDLRNSTAEMEKVLPHAE